MKLFLFLNFIINLLIFIYYKLYLYNIKKYYY